MHIGKSNFLVDLSRLSIPFNFVLESNFFFLSSQHVKGVEGLSSWDLDIQIKFITVPSLVTPTIFVSSTNFAFKIASFCIKIF